MLIDGRTVYSPLFSGVFWDAEDVVLADIERIEGISGPSATLWGANAVNGVINVITRDADETQGAYAFARTGREGGEATAQFGGALGDAGHYPRLRDAPAPRQHRARQRRPAGRPVEQEPDRRSHRLEPRPRSHQPAGDAYHAS